MKKWCGTILFILVGVFSFTGCGLSNNETKSVSKKIVYYVDDAKKEYTYNANNKISFPEDPKKDGYEFDGWCFDLNNCEKKLDEDYFINNNKINKATVYAKFNAVSYTITYVLEGENNSENPSTYTIESETIQLKAPTLDGYAFEGWYTENTYENEITEIVTGSVNDITLYAKKGGKLYNINYVLNGGVNNIENLLTYSSGNQKITLKSPTRDGYDFVGWYTDEYFENKIEEIPAGAIGNITLYADWKGLFELDLDNNAVTGLSHYGLNKGLINVTIPRQIDGIDIKKVYADNMANIETIKLYDTVEEISAYGNDIYFMGTLSKWLTIKLRNTSVYFGDLYINGEKQVDVIIPNDVTSVDFRNLNSSSVSSVTLHEGIENIEVRYNTFDVKYTSTLDNWLKVAVNKHQDGRGAFIDGDLYIQGFIQNIIVIPSNATSVDLSGLCFSGINKIVIHKNVISLSGNLATVDTNKKLAYDYKGTLEEWFNVTFDVQHYYRGAGITGYSPVIDNSYTQLYIDGVKQVNIVTPQSVTNIYAFTGLTFGSIESVVIKNNVTFIMNSSFGGGIILFCEPTSKPEGWGAGFYKGIDNSQATVYWGNQWEYVSGVPTLIPNN